jgi:site-specific DNA-methyltransferase (cytosine-N4-specific)
MTGTAARIIQGNALALPLFDASVDLVVTSPPYFGLRSYQDGGEHYAGQIGSEATPAEFVDALIAATREMVRVLKPSGSIWVNLGDKYSGGSSGDRNTGFNERYGGSPGKKAQERSQTKGSAVAGMRPKTLIGIPWRYAIRCIDDLGLILRAEIIWSKPNGLPESVTDRVRRSHEQWFHFVKQPRYFSAVDEIREVYSDRVQDRQRYAGRDIPKGKWSEESGRNDGNGERGILGFGHQGANPLGKLPGSVWTVATQPLTVPAELGIDHFAAFPMEWPRRIIQGWSPAGVCVLDPFGGTGTVALMAKALGRIGISVDMSADYCRLATWRTTDPGQMAAALQVEKPEPISPDQLDLFGEVVA